MDVQTSEVDAKLAPVGFRLSKDKFGNHGNQGTEFTIQLNNTTDTLCELM